MYVYVCSFYFFFVNRISVHAKQRQIHKNFVDLRDKGPCVVQFADTPHVTRKLILEVLAHSCVTLCLQFHSLSCFVQCDDNYSFFFGHAVCCVHLWSKFSIPKISSAFLSLFSCSFINKGLQAIISLVFFFGETVFCVHLCSRKVINRVE